MTPTTVAVSVTVDDDVVTIDCSHCGRLTAVASDSHGRATARGTVSVHTSLHLTQLERLGRLMTAEQTREHLASGPVL